MKLVEGTSYDTKNLGRVIFRGMDHYMGQTTYKLELIEYGPGYRYVLPAQIEEEMAINFQPKVKKADLINRIINSVAELPDRTSPEDFPEALLVTAIELREILESHLASENA